MIEIKSRWDSSKVLYVAKDAADIREALEEAVKRGANLGDANLGGANLGDANLRGANLRGANLRGANLGGAYLRGANLGGANLRGANLGDANLGGANLGGANLGGANLGDANLGGANLRGANLGDANLGGANLGDANLRDANLRGANLGDANRWDRPLWSTRQDFFSILDLAPIEVAGLRQTMVDGKIDGSTYSGPCSCLAGTIATVHGCDVDSLKDELGIEPNGSRPAEQWFMPISEGNKPLPTDTEEWPDEGTFRLSLALAWLDEWVESRKAIAKALAV